MSNAFNLSQLANNVNSSGLLSASAGVTGTLPIANGGTNSTATATAGGIGYGTGTAHAFTAAGTSGQVLTSAGASAPTWASASGLPIGTVIQFAATSAPTGYLLCPTSLTNISRTTYSALFAVIGTTWGAGDGSTTFGLPWLAANYAAVQASANVGTATTGQVIAHTHTIYGSNRYCSGSTDAIFPSNLSLSDSSGSTGGTANLTAGARLLFCIKY